MYEVYILPIYPLVYASLRVDLQYDAFRFRGQNYNSVSVSLPKCITYIHCFSSQVDTNGVSLSVSNGHILSLFFGTVNLSRGGSILYLDTQDSQFISRFTREVRNAFPDLQSAFTPVYLFIATWLQIHPFPALGLVDILYNGKIWLYSFDLAIW